MTTRRKKPQPVQITRADINATVAKANALEADAMQPADLFPLSKRATADDVRAAGIVNGMDPVEVEARLSKVMT